VRGLDYYNKTVFEWITDRLGAQGTLCAGGRFDGLVEQLGGKPVPAAGFAMGIERLVALMEELSVEIPANNPHAYFVMVGDAGSQRGMQLAEELRSALPQLQLVTNCGGGSFKSQFKRADKSGAQVVLVLGEDELNNNTIGVKDLRAGVEQETVAQNEIKDKLKQLLFG
jgi:histidyl-tRNA synthetase